MKDFLDFIKANGYIKSFTKFDEEEEDGYIICGKVVFNNGLTVTAAFYR